jgi:hypothetical protein
MPVLGSIAYITGNHIRRTSNSGAIITGAPADWLVPEPEQDCVAKAWASLLDEVRPAAKKRLAANTPAC